MVLHWQKKAKSRENTVRGTLKLNDKKSIRGKNILIIDDVYTTGATIREMFRILDEGQPANMSALIFAKYESKEYLKKWFRANSSSKSL